MTLVDDVGRVLWLGFGGDTVTDELGRAIGRGELGAVLLFQRNLVTSVVHGPVPQAVIELEALRTLTAALHAAAPRDAPLLIAIDQEGGEVQRLRAPATQWPPMLALDAQPDGVDVELADAIGFALGRELAALGIDVDLAPILDIHTNPANPVIGDRAFGTTAATVTRRALAVAAGLARAGVLACGKHFPGHGDTSVDSHLALPRIDHDEARLDAVELAPFRAAAAAGLPLIMTAHVVYAALDAAVPATLSRAVVDGVLRQRLGYRGVIVSDDLAMRAIVDHFGAGDAAVRAIRAGCDALVIGRDRRLQHDARAALIRAAERDSALRDRLGEAAARIRTLAVSHAAARRATPPFPLSVVGALEHRRLADRLAR